MRRVFAPVSPSPRAGGMPLVEVLEYREVKRIREFAIAIDTWGSVAGDKVQKFVQKTYNVLKSTESSFSRINLHIIQCDAEIQEDVKVTTQEELEEHLRTMKVRGLGGGTDFRPVFSYVDELCRVPGAQARLRRGVRLCGRRAGRPGRAPPVGHQAGAEER